MHLRQGTLLFLGCDNAVLCYPVLQRDEPLTTLTVSLGDTATQHLRKLDLDLCQFSIREKCPLLALTAPDTYLSISQVCYTEGQQQHMQMASGMTYREKKNSLSLSHSETTKKGFNDKPHLYHFHVSN